HYKFAPGDGNIAVFFPDNVPDDLFPSREKLLQWPCIAIPGEVDYLLLQRVICFFPFELEVLERHVLPAYLRRQSAHGYARHDIEPKELRKIIMGTRETEHQQS